VGDGLVLNIKSRWDASGATAATAATERIVGSTGKATDAAKKMGEEFVQSDIRMRRVEMATRALAPALGMAASGGLTMASGAQAASIAVGFLGNAVRFASGPIGIAFTVATALGSAYLAMAGNAEQAKTKTAELTIATQAFSTAAREALNIQGEDEDALRRGLVARSRLSAMTDEAVILLRQKTEAQLADIETQALSIVVSGTLRGRVVDEASALQAVTLLWNQHKAVLAGLAPRLAEIAEKEKTTAELTKRETQTAIDAQIKGLDNLMKKRLVVDDIETDARNKRFVATKRTEQEILALRLQNARASAGVAGALAGYLETTGQASFETIKRLRYAEAIVNIAAGVTHALASENYIGAIAVAAMGAIQIATIAQTSPAGGGSVTAPSGALSSGPGAGAAPGPGAGGQTFLGGAGAGAGGGLAGATITVHADFYIQTLDVGSVSDAAWKRIVRKIADGLAFELNGLRNSFGG
jgi:hypothetical protein